MPLSQGDRIESSRQCLKGSPAHDLDIITTPERGEDEAHLRIRCPLCEWEPGPGSEWACVRIDVPEGFRGGCGTVWNTFATRGRCPGCQYQWKWTKCLRCGGWSLHEDWYEETT